ncbi:MAG: aminodeoxychorismate/anthranilate synthase component II [Nitrospirae bacterium]|nr:aminodeoxychorismate/anthranilate synthase component II [Nitrospirota bacterium]
MILMIDNYDSFTYNLVQYVEELGEEVRVFRNDKIKVEEIRRLAPRKILISPGPCTPAEAGISVELVRAFHRELPILGVCLGHQSIGAAFGGKIVAAKRIMHGKVSRISHDGEGVYRGLENPFSATRYHSLVVEEASLPAELKVTSRSEDGEIMGIRHKVAPLEGVQFHPESILTTEGKKLIANFLSAVGSPPFGGQSGVGR